jgi:3',5'-cyclic AMP phosphodiesterase CpdA
MVMKLYAISDLHVGCEDNRRLLWTIPDHPEDWLIVAGDVAEKEADIASTLRMLASRFQKVLWVPGNHELWTIPSDAVGLRGEAKYRRLVSICRSYGVLTPEDPYVQWPGAEGPRVVLAPLFLLYDYSFRPDHVSEHQALSWAMESGVVCMDEAVLHPDPYPSRKAWCEARCKWTEARLSEIPADCSTVLINHFPLRRDLAILPAIPNFTIWCGTRRTEDWHSRFRAAVVVSGHLHIRSTRWRDGVRFEEVSLGYPRQRGCGDEIQHYLCEILPGKVSRAS